VIPLTLREIAGIVDGTLEGNADPHAVVTEPVAYDSRQVRPGGLFLAIAGEHADGHDFARSALAAGAVAAIVTRPLDVASIRVPDALRALGALAAAVVRRLDQLVVVGITGSSGKTSTKDLVGQLLQRLGPTVAPPGSLNNELGHPYTVLHADQRSRFLVLETSARGVGHIRYLTQIAPPRIGAVLNVGHAHVGEFGSQAAIAQAKGELVEALPAAADGGVAVLNADDPLVAAMVTRTDARLVTVGEAPHADVRAENVRVDRLGRPSFTLRAAGASAPVGLLLSGQHQVGNALAAAAVALACGLGLPDVAATLSAAPARSRWRMEITERADGVVVVNDAYNANPESMRAALKTLAEIGHGSGARTVAVLGPMAELGPDAPAEHDALGRLAVRLDIARLVAVGTDARPIAHGAALEGSWDGESSWVPDVAAAIDLLRNEVRPGDVVLVKASRAARLERVALALGDDAVATGHEGSGGA
jgi:UDP-N-acetylmuramoyl-tripeptide--D-alanyl-D-alanine ligase